MKGIILAAGKGTRLYPMTKSVCKPLLPVYDKPLIYYPLSVLIQAGIKDILIIIPPGEEAVFRNLLGSGEQLGINVEYKVQHVARGIADAFIIGESFIGTDAVCLALGDNIFYHHGMEKVLEAASDIDKGAKVFGYWVEDPTPFGVVEFDEKGSAISIEEKPSEPKSNYIIPGLYFYDKQVVDIAKNISPSARGELEITDVNMEYLKMKQLHVIPLEKDVMWYDTGTADSLIEAAEAIKALQSSGKYIACIEKIAWEKGFIGIKQLKKLGEEMKTTKYGQYLINCI